MEIAVLVAEDEFLLECFVTSGRVTEFADAMALTSAAMVNSPHSAKKLNQRDGTTLSIWDIEVTDQNGNGGPSTGP